MNRLTALRAFIRPGNPVRRMSYEGNPDVHLTTRERCIKYKSTVDDLSVPSGSWKAENEKLNRMYNIFLAGTTAFMVASIAFLMNSGVIYSHDPPPQKNPRKSAAN